VLHIGERVYATLENEFVYSYTGFESKNPFNITSICMMLKLNLFKLSSAREKELVTGFKAFVGIYVQNTYTEICGKH
jgi:hypothetical protein